jgi:hypothetical protein
LLTPFADFAKTGGPFSKYEWVQVCAHPMICVQACYAQDARRQLGILLNRKFRQGTDGAFMAGADFSISSGLVKEWLLATQSLVRCRGEEMRFLTYSYGTRTPITKATYLNHFLREKFYLICDIACTRYEQPRDFVYPINQSPHVLAFDAHETEPNRKRTKFNHKFNKPEKYSHFALQQGKRVGHPEVMGGLRWSNLGVRNSQRGQTMMGIEKIKIYAPW